METTPFEFTPEQKGLLQSLARKTGRSVSMLIEEALEGLQEYARPEIANGHPNGGGSKEEQEPSDSILDIFQSAWEAIPEEDLEDLPTDLAAQHDHYIYGIPKRPA